MKTEYQLVVKVTLEDDEPEAVRSFLFQALDLDRGVVNVDPRTRDVVRHFANELDRISNIAMPPF